MGLPHSSQLIWLFHRMCRILCAMRRACLSYVGNIFLRMKVPALALQFMAQRLPNDQRISFFEPHVFQPASYHAFFLPFPTLVVVTINVKICTHTNKVQETGNTGILRPLLLNKHNNVRAKVNSKKEVLLVVVTFSV